ncbi:MAG: tauA [Hyphomicrobiales bacterium]|nr:tauA [Hyphomicrobiales bacterium]
MSHARVRRALSAVLLGASVLLSGGAQAVEKVKIAYIGGTADVGFYIADARGFLREAGIEAEFIRLDSSARMVAPLATGEIDVGSGAVSAGLYNAFERGVTMKAVADKSGNAGALSYQALVVRKALYDSGEVRGLKDLKGRRIAAQAQGNNEAAVWAEALASVGLRGGDVERVVLGMPSQVTAFANGAIDASFLAEPFLSAVVRNGTGVNVLPVTKIRDPSVTGIIIYSDKLIRTRPQVATNLMKAYVRGLRVYLDAVDGERLAGPGADEVVDIIARYSTVTDKALLKSTIPHAVDPDGRLPMGSLRKDWDHYKAEGLINGNVTADMIVDSSFVEAAAKELGPYTKRNR